MPNTNPWVQRSLKAVWHPCTQMKQHENFPLIALAKGSGVWLYDLEDKRYLDAISSWWTNLFGHANPKINQALKEQLDTLEHAMLAGFTHQPVIELSERLSQLTQGELGHAFYASDGASAIEIALKMSFHYWRNIGQTTKREFICLKNSYHGETIGALAVTDVAIFKDAYGPLLQNVHVAPTPDNRQAINGLTEVDIANRAADELEDILKKNPQKIAAIILEPLVQCAAGMAMYHESYLKKVRQLCDQYEVHLIADEIAVGCGRTGSFFACEQGEIWPDFLTLSKGISGGYLPLSLCLTTDKVYEAFYADEISKAFLHSHSYTGNPLACRAALATLDIFAEENIIAKNQVLSKHMNQAFSWAKEDNRIENFRQKGTILAFDVKNAPSNFARDFFKKSLELEILVRPIGNTVYIMPPYVISHDEVDFLSKGIQKCL